MPNSIRRLKYILKNWDWLNNSVMAEIDNIPEMRPSFDNIRRHDENENEYWSSRDLCAAMGYSAFGNSKKS